MEIFSYPVIAGILQLIVVESLILYNYHVFVRDSSEWNYNYKKDDMIAGSIFGTIFNVIMSFAAFVIFPLIAMAGITAVIGYLLLKLVEAFTKRKKSQ